MEICLDGYIQGFRHLRSIWTLSAHKYFSPKNIKANKHKIISTLESLIKFISDNEVLEQKWIYQVSYFTTKKLRTLKIDLIRLGAKINLINRNSPVRLPM